MTVLQAIGLTKRFGAQTALAGLDLQVAEGEVLALLGPTGAGKTTTLRAIAGLETLDAGEVRLDGHDVTELSPRARDVAVVFEGFNLLPTLSVYENIAFPLRSPVYREDELEVRRRVDRASTDLKIERLLDRRIDQLSGGEKQRVAIARALVRKPRVHLLDEPLSALDLKLREALQYELKQMHHNTGATVVYASHDFPSAAEIATRIALVDEGRVLQTGTLTELIADPRLAAVGRLVGSPAMAQFAGRLDDGLMRLEGVDMAFEAPALGLSRIAPGPAILGIWPEDIEIATQQRAGFAQARVYATDFRGRDRAIEAHFGPHRFRKAVHLDVTAAQSEPIWFAAAPEKCFVFDASSGRRLNRIENPTP